MIHRWTAFVLMAIAFDNNCNPDPTRDEWEEHDLGMVPDDIISQHLKSRFPRAICIKALYND